jgi:branched-chain amino acid transport system ATP-binding protein
MLRLSDLDVFYGPSHVLRDVSLEVGAGEVVALLGRNGAGKSTTLKATMGLVPARAGRVEFAEDLRAPPDRLALTPSRTT